MAAAAAARAGGALSLTAVLLGAPALSHPVPAAAAVTGVSVVAPAVSGADDASGGDPTSDADR